MELPVQLDEQPRAGFAQQLLSLCKSSFRHRRLVIASMCESKPKRFLCCVLRALLMRDGGAMLQPEEDCSELCLHNNLAIIGK